MHDPDPSILTHTALLCAMAACEGSAHYSDRMFAYECSVELQRRRDGLPSIPVFLAQAVRESQIV